MSEIKTEPGRDESRSAVVLSPEEKQIMDKSAQDVKACRPESRLTKWLKNPPLFIWWYCW